MPRCNPTMLPKGQRTSFAFGVFLLALLISTSSARSAESTALKDAVSLGLGLPLPVGGLVSAEYLHRIDDKNFVMLGGGSALLIHGVYLSYGRRMVTGTGSGSYAFAGFDGNLMTWPEPLPIPGAHVGIGNEWFPGSLRLALSASIGVPWLIGLRFSLGVEVDP